MRQAEHFIALMKRVVEYLKLRLRIKDVVQESPARFLLDIRDQVGFTDLKPLRFFLEFFYKSDITYLIYDV